MPPQLSTATLLKSVKSLYLEGNFEGAIELLLKNRDQLDGDLFHYNLGTLYLKNENWGMGRYHLEKALKGGFALEMESKNLSLAKSRPGIVDLGQSKNWEDQYLDAALSIPDKGHYLIAPMILAILFLFLIRQKVVRSWRGGLFACLTITFPIIFYFAFLAKFQEAIVLKDSPVREGPSQIYEENTILPEGSKIIIGKQKEDWSFVRYPREVSGWVNRKNLGLL